MKNEDSNGDIRSMPKNIRLFYRILNIPASLLCVYLVYLLNIPNPMMILIIPVVFFAFSDGYQGGAMSGMVAVMYSLHFFLIATKDPMGMEKATTIILAVMAIVIMVGKLKSREVKHKNNITKLKEVAEQSSRHKTDFLAKMSHEIRTPMNAIVGMTELVLREDIPNTAREHTLAVKQAGSNLLAIINDLLDFTKIETGMLEIMPRDYSVSSLLNDVVSIIRMRLLDSQICFAVNVDSNIPGTLFGDEMRIRQALINVLGNAVKYTEKGSISLSVSGEFVDENTINAVFEIIDTGKGIKREDFDKLFRDFTQLDPDKNREIEGVGLGLAITRNIVKAMGGDIGVKSEYGKGSAFAITIPQEYHIRKAVATVENPGDIKVIVYDRREIYADSIIYTIGNLGVHGTLVKNDPELQGKLSEQSYDFIFISFALYAKNKDLISNYGNNAKIVILTEFGEIVPDASLNVVTMPAYCVAIANILSGVYSGFSYETGSEAPIRFTAPKAKVLVVDDITTNLKVTQGLLSPYNMKVDLCKSGMAAIKAVQSKDYDLVLMDHKMPEMDGVEATRRIRETGADPYYKNVPIVALTANAVFGTREMLLENGFDDFLSKPIDTIMLNEILEKWLPKIKQEKFSLGQNDSGRAYFLKIEGVDISTGISRSGGTTELYLKTLGAFYKDGTSRIKEIAVCLERGDFSLYKIHVHALKEAAMIIGANELPEAARDLEMTEKENDITFVKAHNPGFIQALETLLGNIDAALKKVNKVEF